MTSPLPRVGVKGLRIPLWLDCRGWLQWLEGKSIHLDFLLGAVEGVLYHSDTFLVKTLYRGLRVGVSTHEGACFGVISNIY